MTTAIGSSAPRLLVGRELRDVLTKPRRLPHRNVGDMLALTFAPPAHGGDQPVCRASNDVERFNLMNNTRLPATFRVNTVVMCRIMSIQEPRRGGPRIVTVVLAPNAPDTNHA